MMMRSTAVATTALASFFLAAPLASADVYTVYMTSMEPPVRVLHPPMRMTHPLVRAINEVEESTTDTIEEACSMDVAMRCSMPFESMMHNDPIMEWIMKPPSFDAQPPRMILDMTSPSSSHSSSIEDVLNEMIDSALRLPMSHPFLLPLEEEHHEEAKKETSPSSPAEEVLDTMLSSLVKHVEDSASGDDAEEAPADNEEEKATDAIVDPLEVTKRIVQHGHDILKEGDAVPEERRRLARRLTEVSPDAAGSSPPPRLPFGCHKNHCLWNAFQDGVVSSRCAAAIRRQQEPPPQVQRREQVTLSVHQQTQMDEQDAFTLMFLTYCLFAFGVILLLIVRLRKFMTPQSRRLKRRILQAIYSRPDLKSKIEDEIGEELGHVPPLHPFALARIGYGARDRLHAWKQCRVFRIVGFGLLLWMSFINPLLTMFILCTLMIGKFIKLCCCPKKIVDDCKCCCCGVSTTDVKYGNLTDVQACCKCCNGTGVCKPSCANCCGNGDDDDDEDYENHYVDLAFDEEVEEQEGDCTCCCCGASEGDIVDGSYLTADQACCKCCKGTGVCSKKCKDCCHPSTTQTTTITPPTSDYPGQRRRVYMAVPMQVV